MGENNQRFEGKKKTQKICKANAKAKSEKKEKTRNRERGKTKTKKKKRQEKKIPTFTSPIPLLLLPTTNTAAPTPTTEKRTFTTAEISREEDNERRSEAIEPRPSPLPGSSDFRRLAEVDGFALAVDPVDVDAAAAAADKFGGKYRSPTCGF